MTLIAKTYKGSADGIRVTTIAVNNTGATWGELFVPCLSGGTISITETEDLWELVGHFINDENAPGLQLSVFQCFLPITSSAYTLTVLAPAHSPAAFLRFHNGVRLARVIQQQSSLTTGTAGQSFAAPALTPSENNCLCATACAVATNGTPACSVVSELDSLIINSQGNHVGGALGELQQTTAAAFGPVHSGWGTYARIAINLIYQPDTAANSITYTNIADGTILPRTDEDSAIGYHSGSYLGAAIASVERRLLEANTTTEVEPWTALTGLLTGGGGWSGNRPIPLGGPYNYQLRSKNGSGTVLATSIQSRSELLVGIHGGVFGQSNAANLFRQFADDLVPNTRTRMFDANGWQPMYGDGAITIGNGFVTKTNIPLCLINCAVSGSGLATDQGNGNWSSDVAGQPWPEAAELITRAGGKIEFILIPNGEADARGLVAVETFKDASLVLFVKAQVLTNQDETELGWLQGILGPLEDDVATEASVTGIRRAQIEFATETDGAACAGSAQDGVLTDFAHFLGPHYIRMGLRYLQAILHWFGYANSGALGPRIVSGNRIGATTRIVVTVEQDGGSGFVEKDGDIAGYDLSGLTITNESLDTTITIEATSFRSATEFNIDMLTNPLAGTVLSLRHANGKTPDITNNIYDNTYPQGDYIGLPLLPTTEDIIVGDAPQTPTSLFLIDDDHTWRFDSDDETTASNVIKEVIGFDGHVAMDFTNPIPKRTCLFSAVLIEMSPESGLTIGELKLSLDQKEVDVPMIATAVGEYTLAIEGTSADGQKYTRRGVIHIESLMGS